MPKTFEEPLGSMSLSKIPVEVVEGHMFKYLAWNDLLRLRRVSKECRALVQGYFNTEKGTQRAPEITITASNVGVFTEMSIPTTRVYFRNRYGNRDELTKHENEIRTFVEKYRDKVKHLRLEQFSEYLPNGATAQLLEGLPNLESLSLGQLLSRPCPHRPPVLRLPVFQNLKKLQLHVECHGRFSADQIRDAGFHESLPNWLTECRSLQKLRFSMAASFYQDVKLIVRRLLEALILAVHTGNRWESIEFNVYPTWIDALTVDTLQRLLATCAAKNVAVAGVYANWLWDRRPPQERGSLISSPITGLRVGQTARDLRHFKLDKLATLEISSVGAFMETEVEPSWWSATLQTLILPLWWWNVDVGLFRQLSGGQPLVALQEVIIRFPRSVEGTPASQCLEQLVDMAPNLTELTLIEWKGPPKAFARLLPRLQELEKLRLVDCQRLEDAAFVGSDRTKPAFLQLKNLRRLLVRNAGIEETGLTANCFASVFRHMSLTLLDISVATYSVEYRELCNWLKLLRGGRFAESVEEIKWNGFRLHEIEDSGLREIGKAFRSSNML